MTILMERVIIGIACGEDGKDAKARLAYVDAVAGAGGTPILLPPPLESQLDEIVPGYLAMCDGFVLTGGRDPVTETFGEPTHPMADRESPRRQAFDDALLRTLEQSRPDKPVLGVCLGMQMMGLCAGGSLDQHMPETTKTHAEHMDDSVHEIRVEAEGSPVSDGPVTSWHRQAVRDAGRMRVVARAHDGVIEAIDDPARPFYLGVQWHPERTPGDANGLAIFRSLVACCAPSAGTLGA